jgi:hypothetical protein
VGPGWCEGSLNLPQMYPASQACARHEPEGEDKDTISEMEPHHRLKRMRTLLGRVSEQGPRSIPSIDLSRRPPSPLDTGSVSPRAASPAAPSLMLNSLPEEPYEEQPTELVMTQRLRRGIIDPTVKWCDPNSVKVHCQCPLLSSADRC